MNLLNPQIKDQFFKDIRDTISGLEYSIEPFLQAAEGVLIYKTFFEIKNFYYDNWDQQDLSKAKGLCNHLSIFTKKYLLNLEINGSKFSNYYDVYFANNVFESKFFNWSQCNHVCLVIFPKGKKHDGIIIDPTFNTFDNCVEVENNTEPAVFNTDTMFISTNNSHQYMIGAGFGTYVRNELQVKEKVFTTYTASFDTYIPLFIYKNQRLILAKFLRDGDKMFIEYYERKENDNISNNSIILKNSIKYRQLYKQNKVFSILNLLLLKTSIISDSQVDQHENLISREIEEEHMELLHNIESTIVQTYREKSNLKDSIVSNVLNEIISSSENRQNQIEYINYGDEQIHNKLKENLNNLNLDHKYSKRIFVGALKKVHDSVNGFIKRKASPNEYLDFVDGYF